MKNIPAIIVNQWLPQWEAAEFDEGKHRRRPLEHFYVTSMSAEKLRKLSAVSRRDDTDTQSRVQDTGVQRRHNPERSKEISEYVRTGYPLSELSDKDRNDDDNINLIKPGWLPTAIVVNVLNSDDTRRGEKVKREDLVHIEDDEKNVMAKITLPEAYSQDWEPGTIAPIEVIDGQHRLWAFDGDGDHDYQLPVVIFHGLDISWQAYLFYVINIKPAKIKASLAYDLYPLLRTEDWLETPGTPTVYRETRAQELTEALWSYPRSAWYKRINMLGESGRGKQVTQSAWIKSLLTSFIKKWQVSGGKPGGLYGAPTGKLPRVLPWTRSQQAGLLILIWNSVEKAVENTNADWAAEERKTIDGENSPKGGAPLSAKWDAAFHGPTSLLNTDQGVRAILAVYNDTLFVRADELGLQEIAPNDFTEGTSFTGIEQAINSFEQTPAISDFIDALSAEVAKYDWRTSGAKSITGEETRDLKSRFRGSAGYRQLRQDVLKFLTHSECADVAISSKTVLERLGWS